VIQLLVNTLISGFHFTLFELKTFLRVVNIKQTTVNIINPGKRKEIK
jgi:hypothetical protein